jgi:uncharacterized protein YggE
MRRSLVGSIALVLFFFFAQTHGLNAQGQSAGSSGQPVVVAQGESILSLPADRAYVQIGAAGRATKPADAQRLAATAMTSLLAGLKAIGIAPSMIKTTSYSLQPEYENNAARAVRGFVARNVIEVRVDDLARLADVVDAAGTSGAASMSGLRFDLKDRDAAELDALHRAVRDANQRAQAIAEGAGKVLGEIVHVEEQRTSAASAVYLASVAETVNVSAATPIEPGEVQVSALVTLTIAIR